MLVITFMMIFLGNVVVSHVVHERRDTTWDLHWNQAFYLAEAGIASSQTEFMKYPEDLDYILLGDDGISGTDDDGILSFGSEVKLGNGNYRVVVTDNDDGDDDMYTDADGVVVVNSTGNIPFSKVSRNIEAYVQVSDGSEECIDCDWTPPWCPPNPPCRFALVVNGDLKISASPQFLVLKRISTRMGI